MGRRKRSEIEILCCPTSLKYVSMLPNLRSFFYETVRPLREFIYPPACLGCDQYLEESTTFICGNCQQSLRCVTKGDPLFIEMHGRLTLQGHIDGLISAFHFEKDGTLQSLIHQLKYQEMTRVGIELGMIIGKLMRASGGDVATADIIPVPLHASKRRDRGYNQSDYIAKGIRAISGSTIFSTLLRRKKNTRTQTTLNLNERRDNVRSAFIINSRYASAIPGSSYVLVDDVITTGATIQECARVLKAGGARFVYAASIALADHGTLMDTV